MLEEKYKNTLSVLINEELNSGKYFCFTVCTSSMFPLIDPGDEIVVKKSSSDTLKCGDILVFEKYSELYTHRFLGKRMFNSKIKLITKGDNSFIIDEPLSEEDLLGKVVSIKNTHKSIDLESNFWKTVNVVIGALSYLGWIVFNFFRNLKRNINFR